MSANHETRYSAVRGRGRGSGRTGPPRAPYPEPQHSNITSFTAVLTQLVSAVNLLVGNSQAGDSGGRGVGTPALGNYPPQRAPASSTHQAVQRTQPATGNRTRFNSITPLMELDVGYRPPPSRGTTEPTSDNPDFREKVRRTNMGARLVNARRNWEHLPPTIDAAIDRVTASVKPPAATDSLHSKLQRAADVFKNSIRHAVSEHILGAYSANQRALALLDDRDADRAASIARKQLLRSNGRMNGEKADDLLAEARYDENVHRLSCKTGDRPKRPSSRTPSPPHGDPVPVTNRFEALGETCDVEPMETTTATPRKKLALSQKTDFQEARASAGPATHSAVAPEVHLEMPPTTLTGITAITGACSEPILDAIGAANNTDPPPTTTTSSCTTEQQDIPMNCSNSAPPTPQTSPVHPARAHLSVFPPTRMATWTLPEIRQDEDTLLITDSNGVGLAQATPPTWRVAAYRGGRFEHVTRLLSQCSIPPNIKRLIIAVGTNHKNDPTITSTPLVNTMTRLKEILHLKSGLQILIMNAPNFDNQPKAQESNLYVINDYLRDLFWETGWLVQIPDAYSATGRTTDDLLHFDAASASVLVSTLEQHIRSLN